MRVFLKSIGYFGAVFLLLAAGWFLRERIVPGKPEFPASTAQPGSEPIELTLEADTRMAEDNINRLYMSSVTPEPLNSSAFSHNIAQLDASIDEAPIEGIDAVALLYFRATGGPIETSLIRPGRFWGLRVHFRESGRSYLLIYDYSAPPREWVIKAITIFRSFKEPPSPGNRAER
jgi:hypothetical protein